MALLVVVLVVLACYLGSILSLVGPGRALVLWLLVVCGMVFLFVTFGLLKYAVVVKVDAQDHPATTPSN